MFGNELMTGFLNTGVNPISRLSIGSLEDLGYRSTTRPPTRTRSRSPQGMAIMGVGAQDGDHGGHGVVLFPPQTVLPDDALRG